MRCTGSPRDQKAGEQIEPQCDRSANPGGYHHLTCVLQNREMVTGSLEAVPKHWQDELAWLHGQDSPY